MTTETSWTPPDPTGIHGISDVVITPDGDGFNIECKVAMKMWFLWTCSCRRRKMRKPQRA